MGVLVECGFISKTNHRSQLMQPSYQQAIAKLLTESVCEYLEVLSI